MAVKTIWPGAPGEGNRAGGDSANDSAKAADSHDAISGLIARIRDAAEAGAPLANAARVRVRRVRPGLYRVEREGRR